MRVIGYLNPFTCQLHSSDYGKVRRFGLQEPVGSRQVLSRCRENLGVLDNWPVHFHPKVLLALKSEPRIELLRLPTYAPW